MLFICKYYPGWVHVGCQVHRKLGQPSFYMRTHGWKLRWRCKFRILNWNIPVKLLKDMRTLLKKEVKELFAIKVSICYKRTFLKLTHIAFTWLLKRIVRVAQLLLFLKLVIHRKKIEYWYSQGTWKYAKSFTVSAL